MSRLAESADRIVRWHDERARRLPRLLREGLTPDKIHQLASDLGWRLPTEGVELFRWRNGVRLESNIVLGDVYFFPGYYLLSLEEALANRQLYVDDALWPSRWLPILASGGGDFIVLDCERQDEVSAPIVEWLHDDPRHWDEYSTLSAMIRTLAEGYARGAFYLTPDGFLEVNDQHYARIARQINPGIDVWHTEPDQSS